LGRRKSEKSRFPYEKGRRAKHGWSWNVVGEKKKRGRRQTDLLNTYDQWKKGSGAHLFGLRKEARGIKGSQRK